MTDDPHQEPERLESDELIPRDEIAGSGEMKAKWSIYISGLALVIGVIFLGVALWLNNDELRTWSMGLISLVVGAALGYAFSGNRSSD